jgi:hypothetical protein
VTAGRTVLLLIALGACKGRGATTDADSSSESWDGGANARDASRALVASDASPPDDTILPVPTEELAARARHLLEAIAKDDATLASDILFPRDGWLATRDAPDPGKDWEVHVATPFRRAVHALSRRHHELNPIQAVSIELGGEIVEATPRRHGWRKPLWTVTGSRLTFVAGGHTRTLSIREMVAWRGAWYVARLR